MMAQLVLCASVLDIVCKTQLAFYAQVSSMDVSNVQISIRYALCVTQTITSTVEYAFFVIVQLLIASVVKMDQHV